MSDEKLELIVDSKDNYLDSPTVFYIHPERLSLVRCLNNNQFDSVLIKNSPIDCLTSMNFSYILRKMKIGAELEVIICQPLSIMQSYDGKQVEANAKLAGFDNFKTVESEYVDDNTDKKFTTVSITAVKPEKNPNEVEVQVTITGKNKTADKNTKNSKNNKVITETVTTTTSVTYKKGTAKK